MVRKVTINMRFFPYDVVSYTRDNKVKSMSMNVGRIIDMLL